MVDLWQVVIGGSENNMEHLRTSTALEQAAHILSALGIEDVLLSDHKPVLRIQVCDAMWIRVLACRTELVEQLKPTGFRFIALDLDSHF